MNAIRQKAGVSLAGGVPFHFSEDFPHYPYKIPSAPVDQSGSHPYPISLCKFAESCPAKDSGDITLAQSEATKCEHANAHGCPL